MVLEDKEEWKKQENPEKKDQPERELKIDSIASRMCTKSSVFLQALLW